MPLPNYTDGSLVNLMSSLLEAMAGPANGYLPLADLKPEEISSSQNIILFVIDGLGYEYLLKNANDSFLSQYLRSPITSVFPSTTATAITSFMTGQAPQQHGLTAWHTYLKELGCITAVLPFRPRVGSHTFDTAKINARQLYNHTSFFDLIQRPSYVVAPEWIIHSEFNEAHSGSAYLRGYDNLQQCFDYVSEVSQQQEDQKYIYAYWPDFDRYSHEYGNASSKVASHYEELCNQFEKLFNQLTGSNTSIIITADHGFVDIQPEDVINLHDHPELEQALVLPLSGEPRVAYCYVNPDKEQQFVRYIEQHLADKLELIKSEQLIEQGYFGKGTPHPELLNRIGHYALIMKDNYVIKDRLAGEQPFVHIGVHGGTSREEMLVPLIVAHL